MVEEKQPSSITTSGDLWVRATDEIPYWRVKKGKEVFWIGRKERII